METTMAKSNYMPHYVVDDVFDNITSPQFMDFGKIIPEAKDSFFDRIGDTGREINKRSSDLITFETNEEELPNDIEEYSTRELEPAVAVNPAYLITSTPFRATGAEPMQWRPNAKPEVSGRYTKSRPFSFEERNKKMQQRKAQRIQTILQAEKEARKFRANPVPKFLRKPSPSNAEEITSVNPMKRRKLHDATTEMQVPRFKARSPKVLRRAPFQPILPKQPLKLPDWCALKTEIRAEERKAFDNYLKEKERLDEEMRRLKATMEQRREEEEIKKMRKETVTKAQPIRRYAAYVEQGPKRPLTEPITPRVIKRQRR